MRVLSLRLKVSRVQQFRRSSGRLFDGRSTAYLRSWRSQWRNQPASYGHVDLHIFFLFRPQCSSPSPRTGRPTVVEWP